MTNQITAEIIADSVAPNGSRLTSFIVVIPRIVLAEFNTHRALSRNSASSRAIPFQTMLKKVQETPFIPLGFQKDHKGMQGNEYMEGHELERAQEGWLAARDEAVKAANHLHNLGCTKQLCNRLLEPFLMHTIIVTASEWENFFALRAHPAAEIHIADCAYKMLDAYNNSQPKLLKEGEWHIPFGDRLDTDRMYDLLSDMQTEVDKEDLQELKVNIATARCARVSYLNYEGGDDYQKDVELHDRLSSMGHWSPFEHCARVKSHEEFGMSMSGGNFNPYWIQYRKTFFEENKIDNRVDTSFRDSLLGY